MNWLRPIPEALAFLAFCLILLFLAGGAQARTLADTPTSPLTFSECLPRDLHTDLATAGAEPWEVGAIEAVASGRQGRDLITFTDVSCGSAGFASFAPGRLGLNLSWVGECAWDDPGYRWAVLELLYSDASAAVQLAAFRRINGRAIQEAHAEGFPRRLAALMANAGPNRFLREARAREWDHVAIIEWYVSGGDSERRRARIERWL